MFEKFTDDARRALHRALREAASRRSAEIEPAYLLLAVLQQGEIEPFLAHNVAKIERIRAAVDRLLPPAREVPTETADLPLAHASKRILAYAAEESLVMRHATITSAHLLLGILRDGRSRQKGILRRSRPTSPEAAILIEHGIDYDTLRARLRKP